MKLREFYLALFFGLQIVGIGIGRFTEYKYFCWVPYDQISTYRIEVKIGNYIYSKKEITGRYKIENPGRENRSIGNIKSIIKQYETTYGYHDRANVNLIYNTNGNGEQTWVWPED